MALQLTGTDEAARLLVKHLSHLGSQGRKALEEMGPVAAPAVASLLNGKDARLRRDALKILGQIGTRTQLPAVRKAQSDSDGIARMHATKAIQAIEKSGR